MLATNQYQIRRLLQEQSIIFCYSGYMTETILSGIGQALKQKMTIEEADTKTIRGVFAIFVEQMQNMIRYSAEVIKEQPDGNLSLSYGLLTIGQENQSYFVTCGNKILSQDVKQLCNHLDTISKMDRSGLKILYKQILKGETPEGSKGAGVGFIDIARKATQPIEYDFVTLDSKYSFFSLKAFI